MLSVNEICAMCELQALRNEAGTFSLDYCRTIQKPVEALYNMQSYIKMIEDCPDLLTKQKLQTGVRVNPNLMSELLNNSIFCKAFVKQAPGWGSFVVNHEFFLHMGWILPFIRSELDDEGLRTLVSVLCENWPVLDKSKSLFTALLFLAFHFEKAGDHKTVKNIILLARSRCSLNFLYNMPELSHITAGSAAYPEISLKDLSQIPDLGSSLSFPVDAFDKFGASFILWLKKPDFVEVYRAAGKYSWKLENLSGQNPDLTRIAELLWEARGILTDPDAFSSFVSRMDEQAWDCSVMERVAARMRRSDPALLGQAFQNRTTMADFLTGSKWATLITNIFGQVKAQRVSDILDYALIHKKNAFLRLVSEHTELFLECANAQVFLMNKSFWKVCNLNALTDKDLNYMLKKTDGGGYLFASTMKISIILSILESSGMEYTFQEVATLAGHPSAFTHLYVSMRNGGMERVDERLRRIRQVLHPEIEDVVSTDPHDMERVAAELIAQPFEDIQSQYTNIHGLSRDNLFRLLMLDTGKKKIAKELFKEAGTNHEVNIVLSNIDSPVLKEKGLAAFIKSFTELDKDSKWLMEYLNLPQEQVNAYHESISDFCLLGCATIAHQYYSSLVNDRQRENLRLVILACISGRLEELKYSDFEKELDYHIREDALALWKKDFSCRNGLFDYNEYSDFWHCMQIGTLTGKTCMSYKNGCYNECLLSVFDGNKKVIYAKRAGKYYGRAILRLTKYTEKKEAELGLKFRDVTSCDVGQELNPQEKPVLFLERLYTYGCSDIEVSTIKKELVDAAYKRAKAMDMELVIADCYKTEVRNYPKTCRIYVSNSKNGNQYLDSLGGNCESGGYYKSGIYHFYMEKD